MKEFLQAVRDFRKQKGNGYELLDEEKASFLEGYTLYYVPQTGIKHPAKDIASVWVNPRARNKFQSCFHLHYEDANLQPTECYIEDWKLSGETDKTKESALKKNLRAALRDAIQPQIEEYIAQNPKQLALEAGIQCPVMKRAFINTRDMEVDHHPTTFADIKASFLRDRPTIQSVEDLGDDELAAWQDHHRTEVTGYRYLSKEANMKPKKEQERLEKAE